MKMLTKKQRDNYNELTGIAEGIIDNFTDLELKNIIIKNKEDGWKSIRFDYKDSS